MGCGFEDCEVFEVLLWVVMLYCMKVLVYVLVRYVLWIGDVCDCFFLCLWLLFDYFCAFLFSVGFLIFS